LRLRDLNKRKKHEPEAHKSKYQLTAREQTALGKHATRMAAEPPAPRMKVEKCEKATTLSVGHPNKAIGYALLKEALGTADSDFVNGLIGQLANAGSQDRKIDEGGLNFMLAVVKGIKPKDQLEAMLAAQMAAVHMATLTLARRLADAELVPQQDSAERALNKLTRTYVTQMEAFKRYRTGGEQKVTVQHVSVSEGGKAIVGNVSHAAGNPAPQAEENSPPTLTHTQEPATTILGEPERAPVTLRRRQNDGGQSSA
jgi:hypothetical protein